ncbi:hypothetical protein TanjilG_28725 [Lupinus angustifolius]|uniref:SLH domain-containing protein n=1 Tax=Lupinus angustifolius TaxID=3871 RepID=A0A1J7INM6_LUPAN|nr:PREDICTED: uncharacterized protein LOC109337352 isoform X2 [Lupinus angustifolius]OIW16668.1 hypothetical protein TanjilG_28725 [Lupinus angustifolius]
MCSITFSSFKSPSSISHRPILKLNHSPTPFFSFLRPSLLRRNRPLSAAANATNFATLSWFPPPHNPPDDFGGWTVVEYPVQPNKSTKNEFRSYVIVGIGVSLTVLVALFARFSLSRKGFKIQLVRPLQDLQVIWNPVKTQHGQNKIAEIDTYNESNLMSDATQEAVPVDIAVNATSVVEKLERVRIPASVDSTQEEALSVLKSLKIIEDDVEANELCTRREYARWVVKLSSSLERNPRHMIAPIVSPSDSIVTAFDDITGEDPDFRFIQALAEAGVLPSKLSWKDSSNSSEYDQVNVNFFPHRFISRQDLVDWRAQLEYDFFSGVIDQISIKKAGYMDVKEIISPAVYADMSEGDRSILRNVFGQSKRFQPNKPSTKAQAAVALTSGRMNEAIYAELSRIEAENSARQAVAEEIRSELLGQGDIQRFWDEKLSDEKSRGSDVERLHHDAVDNLEGEKMKQDKIYAEHLKEKTAMDCQKQLLLSLKKDVDEISEKLESERVIHENEKHIVQKMLRDLESKCEEKLDTKSTLEAEKEALQIFRSWVEDEARRSQARAAVLEEVGRRWKWDDQA